MCLCVNVLTLESKASFILFLGTGVGKNLLSSSYQSPKTSRIKSTRDHRLRVNDVNAETHRCIFFVGEEEGFWIMVQNIWSENEYVQASGLKVYQTNRCEIVTAGTKMLLISTLYRCSDMNFHSKQPTTPVALFPSSAWFGSVRGGLLNSLIKNLHKST